jgi:hypothetical protein
MEKVEVKQKGYPQPEEFIQERMCITFGLKEVPRMRFERLSDPHKKTPSKK